MVGEIRSAGKTLAGKVQVNRLGLNWRIILKEISEDKCLKMWSSIK
jgi:hypothetical protein